MRTWFVGACGQVDTTLDSRSEGRGFESQCRPCVEVSSKLCIPHCLGPPSRNGYLEHRSKVRLIVAGCCALTARGGKVWRTCNHMDIWTLNRYLYLLSVVNQKWSLVVNMFQRLLYNYIPWYRNLLLCSTLPFRWKLLVMRTWSPVASRKSSPVITMLQRLLTCLWIFSVRCWALRSVTDRTISSKCE